MKRIVRASAIALTLATLAACSSTGEDAGMAAGTGTGSEATSGSTGGPSYAAGSAAEFQAVVGDRVFFGLDRYDLAPEAQALLRRQADWLRTYPERRLTIEGHADERGTREYNLALGERRANSVRDFLVGQGINASRLGTVSYGKERPTCIDADEGCWSQNRRGVSVVE